MPNRADGKRPVQVKFFVDEKGLGLIKAKMTALKPCAEVEKP